MSRFFKAMNEARDSNKGLDKILQGSASNYLPEGTHDVTIMAVDSSKISQDQIEVTYGNADGKQYKDKVFLTTKEGEMSVGARTLLAAVLPSKEALGAFLDEGQAGDNEVFNRLTGMKLRITLAFGKGFRVNMIVNELGEKKFIAVDSETQVPQTEEFNTIDDARAAATAKGLQRAWLRVKKAEATHGEANVNSFLSALAERQKAASNGGVLSGNFVAGTKTPAII